MNELELNAIAEGILNHIKTLSSDPRDGLAILGMALCHLYDQGFDHSLMPFAQFANQFSESLIATHLSPSSSGPVTKQ